VRDAAHAESESEKQYGALAIGTAQGRNMVLLRVKVKWIAEAEHSLKKAVWHFAAEKAEWLQGISGACLLDGQGG